jgi:hypothetical protein
MPKNSYKNNKPYTITLPIKNKIHNVRKNSTKSPNNFNNSYLNLNNFFLFQIIFFQYILKFLNQ